MKVTLERHIFNGDGIIILDARDSLEQAKEIISVVKDYDNWKWIKGFNIPLYGLIIEDTQTDTQEELSALYRKNGINVLQCNLPYNSTREDIPFRLIDNVEMTVKYECVDKTSRVKRSERENLKECLLIALTDDETYNAEVLDVDRLQYLESKELEEEMSCVELDKADEQIKEGVLSSLIGKDKAGTQGD